MEIRLRADALMDYLAAAKLLNVSRMTLYTMIQRGELRPVDIAARRFLIRDDVEILADERRRKKASRKK